MNTGKEFKIGTKIRLYRTRLGLTQQELAEKMGFSSSETISQMEQEKREIKAWELAKIAKILYVNFIDLLADDEIPEPQPVLWRKEPATNKIEREKEFQKFCEDYRMLEKLSGEQSTYQPFPQMEIDPFKIDYKDAERFAENIRSSLNLGERPAATLEKTLQDRYGVKTWYKDLDEGSAASTIGSYGPAILMNRNEPPWRRNYNFAHEIFHLITWESIPPKLLAEKKDLWDKIEKLANAFASCLLLPSDPLRIAFDDRVVDGKVQYVDLVDVARNFDVSTSALIYRLRSLGKISQEDVDSLSQNAIFKDIDRATMSEAWWHPPKFPERFVRLAFIAYQKGNLSKTKLAHLLDTSLFELDKVLQEYGLEDSDSYNGEIHSL
jgi:Zn-dependent peptidase ImmA (M78 family)/DNA-binding XRE family transcriptional regulator